MKVNINKPIFLPGSGKQLTFLMQQKDLTEKEILIIGTGTESIAKFFMDTGNNVIVIVEDQDNLLYLRYLIGNQKNISVRMMDFDNTDFKNDRFDLIYSQASGSGINRTKIIKEIKRILKPGGLFSIGEITALQKEVPTFVTDIWKQSGLSPIYIDDLSNYYSEKGFDILAESNMSDTLSEFYSLSSEKLKKDGAALTEEDQTYYKKVLKKISHESNAYLRLGGNNYIGFKVLILRKV